MTYDEFAEVVGRVSFPGYSFQHGALTTMTGDTHHWLRVVYDEPDVMTGVVERQEGRVWLLPKDQTPGQVVQTCFKAVLTSLEHRCREHFLYKGKPVLQPHLDVDRLWEMMPDQATHATEIAFGVKVAEVPAQAESPPEPEFPREFVTRHCRLVRKERSYQLRLVREGREQAVDEESCLGVAQCAFHPAGFGMTCEECGLHVSPVRSDSGECIEPQDDYYSLIKKFYDGAAEQERLRS